MAEQASRQRTPWRTLWRLTVGDRSLAIILIGMGIVVALVLAIPQLPPTPSEMGPWLAQARARFGGAMPVLNFLGLFSIGDSIPFRMLLSLLTMILLVRAADRTAGLIAGRHAVEPDGEEAWKPLAAGELEAARHNLEKRGYRVIPTDEEAFQADRWPVADGLAFLAHLGPVLVVVGLLIGGVWGWQINPLSGQSGETIDVPQRGEITVPELAPGGRAGLDGMRLYAQGTMPELTITAVDASGESLGLIQTPEADPADRLSLRLSDEMPSTHFAIPEAALFVRVTLDPEAPAGADTPILVQIFRIRSGEQVAEGTIAGPEDGLQVAEGVEIEVRRERYLLLSAVHDPGYGIKFVGLLVTALALIGRILWSPRRLWIREAGEVEGRGNLPRWLIEAPAEGRSGREKGAIGMRILTAALAPVVAGWAIWNLWQEGVLWAGAPLQIGLTAAWLLCLAVWLIGNQKEKESE